MLSTKQQPASIKQLDFAPAMLYNLDLEIFSFSNLKSRDLKKKRYLIHQYTFHILICVTQGTCIHTVDFQTIHAEAGSIIFIRSSQTHSFGIEDNWEGWLILFKPEFLLPLHTTVLDLNNISEELPEYLHLSLSDFHHCIDLIEHMHQDTKIDAPSQDINALLRYQFYTLLLRFSIFYRQYTTIPTKANTLSIQRFKAFQKLVEKHFIDQHQISYYAKQLKCSEKSLTRATMEAIGKNPKEFISSRIILEAKRLLIHTDLTVMSIAENLGFNEPTNFIKFFKRETACTPKQFQLNYT